MPEQALSLLRRDLVARDPALQRRAAEAIRARGPAAVASVLAGIDYGPRLSTTFGLVSDGVLDLWCGDDPRAAAAQDLRVYDASRIGDPGLACIARLPHLRRLELCEGQPGITDAGLADLARHAQRLEALTLWNCDRITDSGIETLHGLPALASLTLMNYRSASSATARILAGFPRLRRVRLRGRAGLDGDAVVRLAVDRRLLALDVSCTSTDGDRVLTDIARSWQGLEDLDVGGFLDVGSRGIQAIATHGRLRRLHASGWVLDDAAMAALSRCRGLERLEALDADGVTSSGWGWLAETSRLAECMLSGAGFDDAAAAALGSHHRLTKVTLGGRFAGPGITALLGLPELRDLRILGDEALPLDALHPLAAHPHLRRLDIPGIDGDADAFCALAATVRAMTAIDARGAAPTGAGFTALARLPQLAHLAIGAGRAQGSDLFPLSQCRGLTGLTLIEAGAITDDGMAWVEDLPGLVSLLVTGCGRLTDVVLEGLALMPALRALGLIDAALSEERVRAFVARTGLQPFEARRGDYRRFTVLPEQFLFRIAGTATG